MSELIQVLKYVNIGVFALLTVGCVAQARRHPDSSITWAAVAFGSLGAISAIGLALQEPAAVGFIGWLVKALIVVLLLFPYFLYRFAAAFELPPRWIRRVAGGSTLVVVAWTLAIPRFPLPGLPEPRWWEMFRIAVMVQWTVLFAVVGTQLWRSGRQEASVTRRRMRTLALAAAGMDAAILLSGIVKAPQSATTILITQVLFVGSSILFFVGLAPPGWLVGIWRRPDEAAMRTTMNELVQVDTQRRLAEVLLPQVVSAFGGRGAALVASSAEVLGWYGAVDLGTAAVETDRSRRSRLRSRLPEAPIHRVELASGTLLLWTSRYAPFFGREELRLLEAYGALVDLLMDRCAIDEQRREAERSLAFQAVHDALTGLPNRVLLMDRLAQAQSRVERRGGAVAVLFLDLDRFKRINDTIDHMAGDALLKRVAENLAAAVRSGDTVARFGGDEFVVVAEVDDEEEAVLVADRMLAAVAHPCCLDRHDIAITASIGLVVSRGHRDPEHLLRDADGAMYRAKDAGRAQVVVFDEAARLATVDRVALERDLRQTLGAGGLDVHYQPVLSLADGAVVGVEALARWEHPDRGMVYPVDFIPLAEESSLIVDLGTHVLEEACRQARAWRDELPGFEDVTMWVNVSGAQLNRMDLHAAVTAALARNGLPHRALGLEITETVFIEQADALHGVLTRLRAGGVRIAIDDFGTGFSSLGRLKDLPTDVIKIDGCFVRDLGTDTDAVAIVAACMALAGALGLTVVAECIETSTQLAVLTAEHCHHGQGHLLGVPLSAGDATAYLHERSTLPLRAIGSDAPLLATG